MENDYELTEWQVEEIKRGLAEAERGEFASEEEVKAVLHKWTIYSDEPRDAGQ